MIFGTLAFRAYHQAPDGQGSGVAPDGDGEVPFDLDKWRREHEPIPNMAAIIAAAEAERVNSTQRTSKFAAVVFDRRNGQILSVASNQFASGISMSDEEMAADRTRKDKSTAHAEELALDRYTSAVLEGKAPVVPPEHLGVYATNFCCPGCSRKISNMKVGTVVSTTNSLDPQDPSELFGRFAKNWASDSALGEEMLKNRAPEKGGPVEILLVTLDSTLEKAAKGEFRWADMSVDHFAEVRARAELQKLGKGGYIPPASNKMTPVANDDREVPGPGKRPGT